MEIVVEIKQEILFSERHYGGGEKCGIYNMPGEVVKKSLLTLLPKQSVGYICRWKRMSRRF